MVPIPPEISFDYIRDNFRPGDIIKWDDFHGAERVKDRFFILATGSICDNIIMLNATSRINLYESGAVRENREFFKIKKESCECLTKDTIVDISWYEEVTIEDVSKLLGLSIRRTGKISDADIVVMFNKIKNSETMERIVINKIIDNWPY